MTTTKTDLESLKEMFDQADVKYNMAETGESEFKDTHPTTVQVLETPNMYSTTELGTGNLGYIGFFTGFGFDSDGKLLWIGAWE